jgi:hypothetical protein
MSSSPQYTGYFSPIYKVQLVEEAQTANNPRATTPIDLTGVSTVDGFTLIMQRPGTEEFQYGLGTWEITDAENGEVAYQWTAGDLATPGRYLVYVTVQLPDEPSPRAFDPDSIRVVLLEKGGAAVATQDVNILEINGQIVSSAHPLPITGPVQVADGGDVTQGAKGDDAVTDHTLDATEIALLKGIVKTMVADGVKLVQSNVQSDYDTGAGTQSATMFGIALPASGGAVPGGTSSNPVRTDPTGTTPQPVSASSLPLPTGAASSAKQDIIIGSVDGVEAALSTLATQTTLASLLAALDTPAQEDGNLAAAKTDLDTIVTNTNKLSIGSALAPYGSNPAQTASAGADTQYKFGVAGNTAFNHVSGQNNSPANVYLAFDQSTTVSGDSVYVIAPGQAFSFDRAGTVLHFSSPAQQSFGGTAGITVEAFA